MKEYLARILLSHTLILPSIEVQANEIVLVSVASFSGSDGAGLIALERR